MSISEYADKYLWKHPQYYFGETWEGCYQFIGQSRDSDCLERSNFLALERILTEAGASEHLLNVREGHWAVGWVEWLGLDADTPTEIVNVAVEVMCALSDYPVIDEELFSEMESDEAHEVWNNCYDDSERVAYIRENRSQFDFYSMLELFECARGKYFRGHASELIF